MTSPADILDDPRYDGTPAAMSVVVSRSPCVIPYGRKKMLKLIGLPANATWEDANPILKNRLVKARKAEDHEATIFWTTIRDALEKKLAHLCPSCGDVIGRKSIQCRRCYSANKIVSLDFVRPLLGKMLDSYLAKLCGRSHHIVKRMRIRRGIPALGKFSGTSFVSPRRDWPDEIISKLGTMPDKKVSILFGLCDESVRAERIRRGITAFKPNKRWRLPIRFSKLLGTMPDLKLAELSGFPQLVINRIRRRRKIPSFRSRLGCRNSEASVAGAISPHQAGTGASPIL